MSQLSLNNALLIAATFSLTLFSFQSKAQSECENAELPLDANGQLTIDPLDLVKDELENEEIRYSVDQETFDCSDIGLHLITVHLIDEAGNETTCQSEVKVVDELAPQLEPRHENFVYLNEEGTATADMTSFVEIRDNCTTTSELDLEFSQETFTTVDLGDQVAVQMRATDAYGNLSQANFLVKVIPFSDGDPIGLPDTNLGQADFNFEFYPNPATNTIILNSKEQKLGTIKILNSTGSEVMNVTSDQLKAQIAIDELATGMYFIECNSKVKRFVKK